MSLQVSIEIIFSVHKIYCMTNTIVEERGRNLRCSKYRITTVTFQETGTVTF